MDFFIIKLIYFKKNNSNLGINMNEKIILGLPKGSLNNVKRGNTYQLFVDAGYEVKGYEPGDESYEIEILNFFYVFMKYFESISSMDILFCFKSLCKI